MTALAVKRSVYDAIPDEEQEQIAQATSLLQLGEPVVWTDGTSEWLLWDSERFDDMQPWLSKLPSGTTRVKVFDGAPPTGWSPVSLPEPIAAEEVPKMTLPPPIDPAPATPSPLLRKLRKEVG